MKNFKLSVSKILGGVAISIFLLGQINSTLAQSDAIKTDEKSGPRFQMLPPEVSRSLKISRLPTDKPMPLIIGTYWDCAINSQGFEICNTLIVVCDDDQEFCTTIE